jgi:beta-lactamase regulating signal transducer with metallopeptidase domain
MNAFFVDSGVSTGLWIALKASALIGVAAIVQAVLYRRASAATRHHIWTLAVLGVLLLPAASFVLPDWAVVMSSAPAAAAVTPLDDRVEMPVVVTTSPAPMAAGLESPPAAGRATTFPWSVALIGIYAAGALGMLLHLLVQQWNVRQFARRATVVQDATWTDLLVECAASIGVRRAIRLLRSRGQTVPVSFGTRRPSIVVPALADEWADDRRRAVILHEVAHVARYDCLTQLLASVACAMYWFHPAAWWVARRLRIERELACDDRVIAAGTRPRDYAGHLLEIAYSLGHRGAPALAVSMARPRQLEGRMLAALDDRRDRRVPAFRFRCASAAVAAIVLLPLAVATPTTATSAAALERVPPAPASPVQDRAAPQLKAIEWPLGETVRTLIRAAAEVIGRVQDDVPGTWEIRATSTEGTVRLRLVEVNSSSDSTIALAQLEGLTAARLAGDGPIQFRLRRDAGTFTFDGVLRRGVGAGTFSFAADPNFPAELAKRGFARPTAREQYQLARHDIGFAFVDELNTQGYGKPQTADLVRAGQHGVQVTYLREMGALGYRLGSLEPLIELRDHGVTPSYVRELAELGYKGLSADEVRRARDHGITPEYVRSMRDRGYGSLPMDRLINARDHGITPEFVRGLEDAGHAKLPLDQLIRVRDHGVTPEYVSEMRQLGQALPIDELVQARDHGVTTEFVREMAALGYGKLTMASLIRLRDHGVTPSYARELKALGYENLALDDLVTLRDHGLTADRIRAANARAGSRLPIDLLKSFAAGGGR